MPDLTDREDWYIRWIALNEEPKSTDEVLVARQQIDREETRGKTLSALKKLEGAKLVKSSKDGRELRWQATAAGREAMA